MKKITNFILSTTEPSKDVGWLKPLEDGSYGMYIYTTKGWSYVGKTKESVTDIKVNGESVVDKGGVADVSIPDIQLNGISIVNGNVANIEAAKKPKGFITVYFTEGYLEVNGIWYETPNTTVTIYTEVLWSIHLVNGIYLWINIHNVKIRWDCLKNLITLQTAYVLLDNVDYSECSTLWGQNNTIKGSIDTSNVTNMLWLYYDNKDEILDVSNLDVSKVTEMSQMFFYAKCKEIKGLEYWDTSSLTNMYCMFEGCTNLTKIDLNHWDTSNVKDARGLFADCTNLESIYMYSFDTRSITKDNINLFWNIDSTDTFALTSLALGENFGRMPDTVSSVDFSPLINWKTPSYLTSLYDRKSNGMSVVTIKLSSATKTGLGEKGITTLTNKGYTIA